MKLTTIVLAAASLCQGRPLLQKQFTIRRPSGPIATPSAWSSCIRTDGNPNGNPDGPTTLSGTGDSSFGGSSPGTSGYN